MLIKLRGQSTAEYAILIAVVIGALIAMQTYVKRGLQGRVKDGVDMLADETSDLGTTEQYEPYYMDSDMTFSRDNTETEDRAEGGERSLSSVDNTSTRASGSYQEYGSTDDAD